MRILILLLLPFLCCGQDIEKAVSDLEKIKAEIDTVILTLKEKKYTPIPALPTFTNAVTISTTATGFNIDNTKLSGKTEVVLSDGTTGNISMTYTTGTKDKPVQFRSANFKTQIGNNFTADRSAFYGIGTKHIAFYGLSLYGKQGSFQWPGGDQANPSTVYIENSIMYHPNFAGFWVNNDGKYYDKVNSNFLRVFSTGGEGLYIGSTNKSNLSKIAESHHNNLYVDSTGWDGVQITSVANLLIDHATVRHTGLLNKEGHKKSLQVHFSSGVIKNSIFDGVSNMEFFSQDLQVINCYISWSNPTDQIYVGENTGNGKPLVFDRCVFVVPGGGALFNVAMTSAQTIVKNSIICANKTLFTGAGKFVDGGGNTFVDKIEKPTYKAETDPVRPAYLVTSDYYYKRGIGYRTP